MKDKVISHFKILEKLGEGGMGVVYKAHDTKLNRTVALKFLPASITANETDKARFLQEAQAAAALNHTNVCTIHEIREHEDQQFIVMEYVEGLTLSEKIKSGPLELKTVIDYAMQIGEGLKAAHAKGIVHRDIKSSNIMVTESNQIKVMDFGLAKLRGSTKLTKTTSTIGTLAYMSPEHLQNKNIDARTDIFSFGVVLYEMLTGELPFKGDYDSALMYSIVNDEPEPVSKFRSDLSSEFMHIMNKVLEKDPEDRYQSVNEMVVDLKRVKRDTNKVLKRSMPSSPKVEVAAQQSLDKAKVKKPKRWVLPVAIVSAVILMIFIVVILKPSSENLTPPMKIVPFTSLPGYERMPTFSPDGNQIAFVWSGEKGNNPDIYVKQIGTAEPDKLTEHSGNAIIPSWSPDGRLIAFGRFYGNELGLYTISVRGGIESKLPIVVNPNLFAGFSGNISWSRDSKSVIFPYRDRFNEPFRLIALNVETHEADTLTYPPTNTIGDLLSAISPDGKTLAFVRATTLIQAADIYVKQYSNGDVKRLTYDNAGIYGLTWTRDGRKIVFHSHRSGNVNLWRISAKGGTSELLAGFGQNAYHPVIAPQGQYLAFVQFNYQRNIHQIELAKTGDKSDSQSILIASTQEDGSGVFSPDGEKIAFGSTRSGSPEIWICDKHGKNERQLTFFGGAQSGSPFWSPSGEEIAFDHVEDGNRDIYVVSAQGGMAQRITTEVSDDGIPRWSKDGEWIYFRSNYNKDRQIWKIPRNGGKAIQVTQNGGFAAFESSDGKWLYYSRPNKDSIWKMPTQGGEETVVINHSVHYRNWVLKEEGIYYMNYIDPDYNIEFFNLKTNEITIIAENLETLNMYLDVSPDRRSIIFTQFTEGGSDIMLVENFR
ncbi:hypothetical protein BVY01_03905 [bacterium I07]|nr:hypothetical protein BVY01_03905 [bacterium I07]